MFICDTWKKAYPHAIATHSQLALDDARNTKPSPYVITNAMHLARLWSQTQSHASNVITKQSVIT